MSKSVKRVEAALQAAGVAIEVLEMAERAESLEKRIRVDGVKTGRIRSLDLPGQIAEALAIGIINTDEAAWLHAYDRKVMDLIHVDDFAPDELGTQSQPRVRVSLNMDEPDVVS